MAKKKHRLTSLSGKGRAKREKSKENRWTYEAMGIQRVTKKKVPERSKTYHEKTWRGNRFIQEGIENVIILKKTRDKYRYDGVFTFIHRG